MSVSELLLKNKSYIIKEYMDGKSTCQLGKEFEVSNASIYIFLRDKCNIEMRIVKQDHNRDKIIELLKVGRSIYSIGKELKVSDTAIHRIAKQIGIDTSKKSKTRIDTIKSHTEEIIQMYNSGIGCTTIAKKFNCAENNIGKLLKKNGVEVGQYSRKYYFDENYFAKIDTPGKAYVCGFIQGDGNNTGRTLRISITDEDLLLDIREIMNLEQIPIKLIKKRKGEENNKQQYMLSVCSKTICNDLSKLGLIQNKTFHTYLPKEAQIPKELLRHFLRGLYDADGTISGNYCGYTGYKDLMNDINDYIHENFPDMKTWIGIANKNYNHNILVCRIFNAKDTVEFLEFLYKDSTIHLKRKYDRYLELKNSLAT